MKRPKVYEQRSRFTAEDYNALWQGMSKANPAITIPKIYQDYRDTLEFHHLLPAAMSLGVEIAGRYLENYHINKLWDIIESKTEKD